LSQFPPKQKETTEMKKRVIRLLAIGITTALCVSALAVILPADANAQARNAQDSKPIRYAEVDSDARPR
jgi:hypothetical protein